MDIPTRGRRGFEIGEKNRRRVWDYFHKNPFDSGRECATALDLSEITVSKAKAAIKAGWKPEEERAQA